MNNKSIYERVAQLNQFVIRHPEFDHAFNSIQECMKKSTAYNEPIGSLLLADGGLGKTTICKAIVKQMPPSTRIDGAYEKTITPTFYAHIPSPASVKSVAGNLLQQLGDPNPLSGSAAQMTTRLCKLLEQCETKLVFLDEFHHLFRFQKTSTKLNIIICDWIKSLVNETKISFCLVGLPQFAPQLEMDSQLARRFQYHFHLHPLTLGSYDSKGIIFPFLAEIENQTKVRCNVSFEDKLDSPLLAQQIYAATNGNPSFIKSLLRDSILYALKDFREIITSDDFSKAWQQGTTAQVSLTKMDPFKMSLSVLASQIRITL
ncbi:TniB family NTP-binding protein [Acinetobacter baumannii]|uniref:TniB family NTP-binding protein n=1 Tax=Acinetobacter nosocomialis TaxID=106654 RepID=UPI002F3EF247